MRKCELVGYAQTVLCGQLFVHLQPIVTNYMGYIFSYTSNDTFRVGFQCERHAYRLVFVILIFKTQALYSFSVSRIRAINEETQIDGIRMVGNQVLMNFNKPATV